MGSWWLPRTDAGGLNVPGGDSSGKEGDMDMRCGYAIWICDIYAIWMRYGCDMRYQISLLTALLPPAYFLQEPRQLHLLHRDFLEERTLDDNQLLSMLLSSCLRVKHEYFPSVKSPERAVPSDCLGCLSSFV